MVPTVYALELNERVGCYYCMERPASTRFGKHPYGYRRGVAYLAGPEHSPCDGNANYICVEHLEPYVNVYDKVTEETYGIDNSNSRPKRVEEFK